VEWSVWPVKSGTLQRAHPARHAASMVTAVAAALPGALGLALAALPVLLIPVALATKRPAGVVRAFLGGWFLGVCVVGAIVILLADVVVLPSGNATWFSYVEIALGLLLMYLAVRSWLARPRAGEVPEAPTWMARVESMTAGKAFGLAFGLASLSPKNLVLVVSGATVIADATSVPGEQVVALIVFALVGSIGVAAPAVVIAVSGERAAEVLAATDQWMTRYSTVIVAVVLAVLGVLLTVNGITGL
jgi:hypothetical protein